MKLYGTFPSHFTRKVRVVLQELQQSHEFVNFRDLFAVGPEHFAHNPLHQFPVLEDGDEALIESDLICEYLLARYGKNQSKLRLLPESSEPFQDRKRLAIMNGGMSAGVTILRARRSGVKEMETMPYFQQEQASLIGALQWLDSDLDGRVEYFPGYLTLLDITLVCFAEWAVFREFLPSLAPYPDLERFVKMHSARPSFAETHPARAVQ